MPQNSSSNQLGNRVLDTLSDCIFKVVESKTKENTSSKSAQSAQNKPVAEKYIHPAGDASNKTSGFYKFSTDETSHIGGVTPVTKQDIITLGIAASDHSHTSADIPVSTSDQRKLNELVRQLDNLMKVISVTGNGLDLGGKYLDNAVFR